MVHGPEFEGQWVIKSFQSMLSKSGFQGLRNNNLRRIDIHQRPMHFQVQSILYDCFDEQWHYFSIWGYFAFFLFSVVFPVLLIVNEEQELEMPSYILLSPFTVAWLFLMLNFILV